MASATPENGKRRPSAQNGITLYLVSGLLILIGVGAFAFLIYSILTDSDIQDATQGLDVEGIGVEVNKIQPQSDSDQAFFSLQVVPDSTAADVGFEDGDVLLSVGESELDATSMTAAGVPSVVEDELEDATDAEQTSIPVDVQRDSSTVIVDVPTDDMEALFLTQDDSAAGLTVNYTPAPYFEMQPLEGGQAVNSGVRAGDRLFRVEDVTVEPSMSVEEVRSLLAEDDVARENDDFEIEIEFLREEADGTLVELTRNIPKDVPPSTTLAFLENFGLIVPIITIGLGIMLIMMGVRLLRYDVVAARWSLVAFLWLSVGLAIMAVWAFWVRGKGGLVTDDPFDFVEGFTSAIPFIVGIAPLLAGYFWLSSHELELFGGDETLTSRNTRFAWTLLVPTIVVLALIAARPLEQTFIKSLTDDEFGTHRPPRYVGLDNYEKLVSFKVETVDCREGDDGDCQLTSDGSAVVWERSSTEEREANMVRELSSEERQNFIRYREAITWQIPGSNEGLRILGKDPDFLKATGNTLRFTFSSVFFELVLGMAIALVVHSNFRGRGLMRTAMLVPWAIPTVVAAVLWQVMLRGDQTGILNKLLIDLGLLDQPEQWFGISGPWMNSIIAVDVWKTAPFMALLLLAGLQTIPADIYEAAAVDGASKVRQFLSITLPLLRPTIAVALIFRTLDALRAFDVFQVLLDTKRPSMASYNYYQLVQSRADGYASAVGVLIFILILIFTVLYVRFIGIEQE